jgi:aryl-alcohol dehydrogenase-like predicted oxidoreductase
MKNRISKLILGTVQFGLNYGINNNTGKVSTDEVKQIFSICEKHGITKLDTSHAYGDSEKVLGEIGSNFNFQIISKYPQIKQNIRTTFYESLSQMKRNKIYGYLVHHFDYYVEKPFIWNDMASLKKDNLVDKIGFSIYDTKELEYLFNRNIDFDIIQFPYNIFDRSFEPYLEELKRRNIEIHTRSVFLQGLFFKATHTLPENLHSLVPYLEKLHSFCERKNISIEELALNAVVHHENIDNVLIGIDNAEQLTRNIRSIWAEYPSDIKSFVDSIDVKEKKLLNPQNWN